MWLGIRSSSLEYKKGDVQWLVYLREAEAQLAGLSRLVRKGTNSKHPCQALKLNIGKGRDLAEEGTPA